MIPERDEVRSSPSRSGSPRIAMNIVGTPYNDTHTVRPPPPAASQQNRTRAPGITIVAPWDSHASSP